MTIKPQPKRELAIDEIIEPMSIIYFYGTPDAIADIQTFETIQDGPHGTKRLIVSKIYDFDEVLEYMRNYEKD